MFIWIQSSGSGQMDAEHLRLTVLNIDETGKDDRPGKHPSSQGRSSFLVVEFKID